MLSVPSFEAVRTFGKFLADSGYDLTQLAHTLDLSDGLFSNLENLQPLLAKTEGEDAIRVLARLLFVGWPVEETLCRKTLPEDVLRTGFEAGLLRQDGSAIESIASLIPFRNRLIACDASRLRGSSSEVVIGPSSSTHLIARFAIGGCNETTLDIGTGSGALSLEAAAYSKRVVGSDINARAIAFAEFTAALNGVADIEFVSGDALQPVAGQTFSRIIANPPFFISAAHRYTYCDSPLGLDGFSRSLAKEAPAYLEDGGYFQMLCEWVQVAGQSWEERIQEWTAESGCDVLVVIGAEMTPLSYAEKRSHEAKLLHASDQQNLFEERMAYFKEQQVERIVGGVINMRKRQGPNVLATLKADPVNDTAGAAVRERIDTLTYVATHPPQDLLSRRFKISSDTHLEQHQSFGSSGEWEITSSELVKEGGLQDRLRLDGVVARFIPLFDGERTLAEIAAEVSRSLPVSIDDARERCLQLSRRLLQSSFVTPGR